MRRILSTALGVSVLVLAIVDCTSTDDVATGGPQADGGAMDGAVGIDGAVDAPSNDAVTCSNDVQSDPKNCGRCGHDCLGGACQSGSCLPIVLAYDRSPFALKVRGGFAYWYENGNGGGVWRVPTAGGVAVAATPRLQGTAFAFGLDDVAIYFDTGPMPPGRVLVAAPLDGGLPRTLGALGPVYSGRGYATDGAYVYMLDGVQLRGFPVSGVPDGGLGSPLATLNNAFDTVDVVASGGSVFLASLDNGITTVPSAGGSPTPLFTGKTTRIALDATHVYFTNETGGSVKRIPLKGLAPGEAPELVAAGQNGPIGLAVDNVAVYWVNQGGGSVVSCPLTGCGNSPPRVLAGDQAGPNSIAIDDAAVYWTTNGSVMKVAK